MPLDIAALSSWEFDEIRQTVTERDTMLYALGLGFGEDPCDKKELQFVYEDGLKTVPSMPVVLGYPGFWLRNPKTGVDWKKVLHGEQWLDIYKPLPVKGTIIGRPKIDFISDKGEGKGAVIYQSRDIINADSGETLARVTMSAFCRGDGGFGGENRAGPAPAVLPERAPDHVCELTTLPRQALIYRLSGDYNPLHADPDVARAAGFERPILHGLATYGLAARAILKTLLDYDASRLIGLDVRFSSPVYPGETVRFDIWEEGGEARFRASIPARGVMVLNNGAARFK
ncbi:MaoC/PaaZ C-terminal domain-containing protein [Acidocella sp.]|uniref:MaoC/PaaZ C-terminal domain-containing protein n=1 Tax=Acidocella sp. TaxID=50710 RepID=UPI00263921F3|nr:MaoC/PaaZ C-terminal domain-containing protein [Acidocella sp.]